MKTETPRSLKFFNRLRTQSEWFEFSKRLERELAVMTKERDELAGHLANAMSDFETASMEAHRIRERANANADLLIGVMHDFANVYRGQMTRGMLEMIHDTLASMEPPTSLVEWSNNYKH